MNSDPIKSSGRWWRLVLGICCMIMVANLQYGWTLFVHPIDEKYHWGRTAIQVSFSLFVAIETWLMPVEGFLVDKFGPRAVVVTASLFVAGSWALYSVANSLPLLYVSGVLAGVGAGAVYGTCVGTALKWFPDRRGLAAGLTAMGYGAGSVLTVIPMVSMIKNSGYETTFLRFGLLQGGIVFVLGWFLKAPDDAFAKAIQGTVKKLKPAITEMSPLQMVRTPAFWTMYVMFTMMAIGGLIATAQLDPIARDYKIADIPVSLMGLTMTALTFALSLDRILNGLTRPFFGWVSDRLGRENTMFIAFFMEGAAVLSLAQFGRNPTAFVLLTALVYFGWGEIYSLFPATCADTYGRKYAAGNAALLYSAKGMASFLVPLSSLLAAATGGSWHVVFQLASVLNFIAAFMAILVLKPIRARMAGAVETSPPEAVPAI